MEPDHDDLRISTDPTGILRVTGEVDLAGAPALDAALRALAADDVRIDLSGVTFLDSSGVNVLVSALNARHDHGGVVLSAASVPVLRTLEISGILPLFGKAA
jgi:anti-sigma B factor antagonist